MKRLLATFLLTFAMVPMALADSNEEPEEELMDFEEEEEHYCDHDDYDDFDDYDYWDEDWSFEDERAEIIYELQWELEYIEDAQLRAEVEAALPALKTLEEDPFFEQVDMLYDKIDAHYDEFEWEFEDDEDFDEGEDEDDDMDEQALIELITQVIMNLKAQGLL